MSTIAWQDYIQMDGVALAEALHNGEISAAELAAQTREAALAVNPEINAVVEIFDDALDADTDFSGTEFAGLPLFMKDMGSRMAGRQQACGYSWMDYTAETDDPLTENYRAAGFNLIGRSTCPEDGITVVTNSRALGDSKNPWNLGHSPGGSSGGAAALVAAGVSPIATSSDGGGSTRFPAAWTGLVGLKTTRGRLPLPIGANESTYACAAEGVVTRTVRDSAIAYEHLSKRPIGAGFMPYPEDLRPLREAAMIADGPQRRPLRIGLSSGNWSRAGALDPELLTALEQVAQQLSALGHIVEPVQERQICDFETLFQGYLNCNWVGPIGVGMVATAAEFGVELGPDNTTIQALNHIEFAKKISLHEYLAAQACNPIVTRQWGQFWQSGYDLLLCPTSSVLCPPLDCPYRSDADLPFEEWINTLVDAARYAMPANETGLPAISLPAGIDSNGCPMGAQLYGPWHSEFELLRLAAELELARPDLFGQLAPLNVSTV
ncbi:MAG: amidase family protein [Cellvibrionaceae bacterium]|nr:amidase family protein [Cellvibrionaceae bacterium]